MIVDPQLIQEIIRSFILFARCHPGLEPGSIPR